MTVNPTCPKCGAPMTGPTYHRNWAACRSRDDDTPTGEHLHYHCVCGYDTTRPTNDAPQKRNVLLGLPNIPTSYD